MHGDEWISGRRSVVLIVDDEPSCREAFASALSLVVRVTDVVRERT